jgi:predicted Rdx family selenoprotein
MPASTSTPRSPPARTTATRPSTGGTYRLHAVDVLTGTATHKGAFPKKYQVTDLALPIDQK